MTLTRDLRSFPEDLFTIAQAFEDGLGSLTIEFATRGQATHKRQQFNAFRKSLMASDKIFREIGKISATIAGEPPGPWKLIFINTGSMESPIQQQIAKQLAAAGLASAKGGDDQSAQQSQQSDQQSPSEEVKASIERFDQRLKELGFGGREGERN